MALVNEIHKRVLSFHQTLAPSPSLEPALQEALGGPEYLTSGLLTRFGHYIGIYLFFFSFCSLFTQADELFFFVFRSDYMAVLRPGGLPVAINADPRKDTPPSSETIRYVEGIKLPEADGCKR